MRFAAKDQTSLYQAHKWFAWHPIKLGDQWIWLETVQRQKILAKGPDYYVYGNLND